MKTAFSPSKTDEESAFSGPSSMVEMSSSRISASPRVATTSLPKAAGVIERGLGVDGGLHEIALHLARRRDEVVGGERIAHVDRA